MFKWKSDFTSRWTSGRQLQTSRLDSHQWEHSFIHGFIPETRKQKGGDFSNFIAWNHLKQMFLMLGAIPFWSQWPILPTPSCLLAKPYQCQFPRAALRGGTHGIPKGAHSKIAGFLAGLRMFIPPKYGKSSGFYPSFFSMMRSSGAYQMCFSCRIQPGSPGRSSHWEGADFSPSVSGSKLPSDPGVEPSHFPQAQPWRSQSPSGKKRGFSIDSNPMPNHWILVILVDLDDIFG